MDTTDSDRWWWAVLVLALALPVALLLRRAAPALHPLTASAPLIADYGTVPDFALIERSGRALSRADLAGTPWFADFIYTTCQGSCPLLSARMATLQRRAGASARMVSFSVDPARDTPAALTRYAERFSASPTGWLFVTGEPKALRELIGKGFHLAVVDPPPGEPELEDTITHSEKIALVDADLRIRRYYDGGAPGWVDDALADLARVGASRKRAS
jgi:protein SCO1